jgi:hypothetical protein
VRHAARAFFTASKIARHAARAFFTTSETVRHAARAFFTAFEITRQGAGGVIETLRKTSIAAVVSISDILWIVHRIHPSFL